MCQMGRREEADREAAAVPAKRRFSLAGKLRDYLKRELGDAVDLGV